RVGSDIRAGQVALTAGTLLTPGALAAAAATGATEVLAHPAPRVGVLSTGSELRPAGARLRRGQVHDSNLVLVTAAVAECGGVPLPLGAVHDDVDAFITVLRQHADSVDAFVTTGGVSEGVYDVVKAALAPLGVWFGSVRMRPGRPQGFGRLSDNDDGGPPTFAPPVFALPGNPLSVFVSFEAFVRPALLRLQGRTAVHRVSTRAVVAEGWASRQGRTHFLPVVAERAPDGGWLVRKSHEGADGPGPLAGLAGANAIAVVAEPVSRVVAGDEVEVWLLG
ncbi:MAG TPA: molybdopterin molybdotransferase MoeA, partial [Terrimesophilobacter sp.]|nr:molybdopterin molybdotransferase MoeA [Terrimesophilobacter sp.]